MKYFVIGLVLLSVLVSAGTQTISGTLTIQTIGNNTFIWTDAMLPVLCNGTCTISLEYEANESACAGINITPELEALESLMLSLTGNQTEFLKNAMTANLNQSLLIEVLESTIIANSVNEASLAENIRTVVSLETQDSRDRILTQIKEDYVPTRQELDSCDTNLNKCNNDRTMSENMLKIAQDDANWAIALMVACLFIMVLVFVSKGKLPLPSVLRKLTDKLQ